MKQNKIRKHTHKSTTLEKALKPKSEPGLTALTVSITALHVKNWHLEFDMV